MWTNRAIWGCLAVLAVWYHNLAWRAGASSKIRHDKTFWAESDTIIILFAAKKQKSLTSAYLRAVWQIGVARQQCLLPTDCLENVKMLREEGLIRLYCTANIYSVSSCSGKWGHIYTDDKSQLLKQQSVRMGPHLLCCSSGTQCPSHAGLPLPGEAGKDKVAPRWNT